MNYEEKYNEALERALKLKVQNPFDTVGQMVEHIFPELQESKDEVIRKAIISCCIDHGHNYQFPDITAQDMLTWLEKQTEKKSMWTDNDRVMAFTLLRDVDQMTYISKEGKNERLEWLNSLEDKFNNVE